MEGRDVRASGVREPVSNLGGLAPLLHVCLSLEGNRLLSIPVLINTNKIPRQVVFTLQFYAKRKIEFLLKDCLQSLIRANDYCVYLLGSIVVFDSYYVSWKGENSGAGTPCLSKWTFCN
jgi:hypothetical protein